MLSKLLQIINWKNKNRIKSKSPSIRINKKINSRKEGSLLIRSNPNSNKAEWWLNNLKDRRRNKMMNLRIEIKIRN